VNKKLKRTASRIRQNCSIGASLIQYFAPEQG